MRARIDVSEIEAQTKIRAKYLRALENEEWSLLPGPTFVKSFLRTYGQALGLDGKALVEEYRLQHERPTEAGFEPIVPASRRRPQPRGPSRGFMTLVVAIVAVVAVLIALALIGSGGSPHTKTHSPATTTTPGVPGGVAVLGATGSKSRAANSHTVALSIHPTGAVYVCLIGDAGRKLINGLVLQAGQDTATFHAHRFDLVLGNSSELLFIDGTARTVPSSAGAIDYAITRAHGRQRVAAGTLPACA